MHTNSSLYAFIFYSLPTPFVGDIVHCSDLLPLHPGIQPHKGSNKFEKRDYLLHLFIYLPAKRNEKAHIF